MDNLLQCNDNALSVLTMLKAATYSAKLDSCNVGGILILNLFKKDIINCQTVNCSEGYDFTLLFKQCFGIANGRVYLRVMSLALGEVTELRNSLQCGEGKDFLQLLDNGFVNTDEGLAIVIFYET